MRALENEFNFAFGEGVLIGEIGIRSNYVHYSLADYGGYFFEFIRVPVENVVQVFGDGQCDLVELFFA